MELEVFWLGGREVNEPIRRADVKRSVARAAESEGLDREAVDRLVREAGERLERDDYGDIMHRRLNAIIVEIHRDLGLPDPRATWDPKRFGYWDRDGNRLPDPTAADSS